MKARSVMLIPIGILAAGSILAGFPFKEYFAGHGVEEFFRESDRRCDPHILEDMHHVPLWLSRYLPTVMMIMGFAVAWLFYIRGPTLPVRTRPSSTSCSTASCSTSGTSTSCMI